MHEITQSLFKQYKMQVMKECKKKNPDIFLSSAKYLHIFFLIITKYIGNFYILFLRIH